MTRIPTAISAAAATVVALATRAPVVMTRISAPVAKATAPSVLPATTAARGLPLMPTAGRGATGLAPALVAALVTLVPRAATPAARAPLAKTHMPATAVPEGIRQALPLRVRAVPLVSEACLETGVLRRLVSLAVIRMPRSWVAGIVAVRLARMRVRALATAIPRRRAGARAREAATRQAAGPRTAAAAHPRLGCPGLLPARLAPIAPMAAVVCPPVAGVALTSPAHVPRS